MLGMSVRRGDERAAAGAGHARRGRRPRGTGLVARAGSPSADRALLAAFVDAHERQDPAAGLAVIREDIRVAMPPNPGLFTGRDAVAGFMATRLRPLDLRRLEAAADRGQPDARRGVLPAPRGQRRYLPFKLDVLRTGGGLIAEITTFDASLFDRFGLPPFLPADDR